MAGTTFRRCTKCHARWMPQDRACPVCGGPRATWCYLTRVPAPEGGKRQVRKTGFTTQRAAQQALRELQQEVDQERYVPPTKMTLEAYLEQEWLPARRRVVRATTWSQQAMLMRAYVIPRIGKSGLQTLPPTRLNALYAELEANGRRDGKGGLSPKSVHHVHRTLHRALKDAVRWGFASRNVAALADAPVLSAGEHAVWTPEQLRHFLTTARGNRNFAYFLVLAGTGMRRGEGLGLKWTDLDLEQGLATKVVRQLTVADSARVWSEPKTAKGRRPLTLDPLAVEALKRHRARQAQERLMAGSRWRDHDLVFPKLNGEAQHPEAVSKYFKRLCLAAGLPHIGLHGLRHTYATVALDRGVPTKVVSEQLGHSRTSITEDLYMHPTDDHRRESALRVADHLYGGLAL